MVIMIGLYIIYIYEGISLMTKTTRSFLNTCFGLALIIAMSACSLTGIKREASYPTRPESSGSDKIVYSDDKRDTIWGEDESLASRLFNKDKDSQSGTGIGVNSFLWRASLDTISFMPLSSADPFGGVILTDWYENPEKRGERFKLNVYILDRQLRADGIRVSVFKQRLDTNKNWRDMAVSKETGTDVENTILTRAREMRVNQISAQ